MSALSPPLPSPLIPGTLFAAKYAFVTTYNDLADITTNADDDEKAAALWFAAQYPTNGDILSVTNVATTDLSQYNVIWIMIDRVGTLVLPASLTDASVVTALTDYYKNGGNLFLSTHATQYLVNLGRIAANRVPGIKGDGNGGDNADIWGVNANIGLAYNHFEHPLFAELPTITFDELAPPHPGIALIGAGHKEDHNCMWDLNSYGYTSTNGNIVRDFEVENTAVVLGTWQHVTDFCCAGIVEFKSVGDYKGRCIAIGLAAYEWNQNSGTNAYQAQIEQLTENVFDYLSPLVIPADKTKSASAYVSGDIIFQSNEDEATAEQFTGQLTIPVGTTLTVTGVVKLEKTFKINTWYPIGFPFTMASYWGDFAENPELYIYDEGMSWGDFWVKSYNSDGDNFIYSDVINPNAGYILQFPSAFNGIKVTFISAEGQELKNIDETGLDAALSLSEEGYYLVANPSVNNLTLTTLNKYYIYNRTTNNFALLTTGSAVIKPFEAFVVAHNIIGMLRTSLGMDVATALENIRLNDHVIKTEYYTLQGIRVQQPTIPGIYIVKKVYASQETEITKTFYKK
ncbi:hypothetical protein FACS189426_06090 [Bacteroidia bacterium]|nr:hypothetical protein FACS189426_06090 [Bacteroidia bacterium]